MRGPIQASGHFREKQTARRVAGGGIGLAMSSLTIYSSGRTLHVSAGPEAAAIARVNARIRVKPARYNAVMPRTPPVRRLPSGRVPRAAIRKYVRQIIERFRPNKVIL